MPVHSFRTKCVCDSLSTFAILAHVNFDSVSPLSPHNASVFLSTIHLECLLKRVCVKALRCERLVLVVFERFAVAQPASSSLSPCRCR